MTYIAAALIIWNLIIAFMYFLDKQNAKNRKWRIPESRLLLPAFLIGGFGAFFGMYTFRHKTKHIKFKILIPLALIVSCAELYLLFLLKQKVGL